LAATANIAPPIAAVAMAPAEPHWNALLSREDAEPERLDLVLLVRVAMVMLPVERFDRSTVERQAAFHIWSHPNPAQPSWLRPKT
jgi:hypothetical protein